MSTVSSYNLWILLIAALVGYVGGSAQDNSEYLFKESVLANPRLLSRGQKYDPEMPSKCSMCTIIWYEIKRAIPASEPITKEILYYLAHVSDFCLFFSYLKFQKYCDINYPDPGKNQMCHQIFEELIEEVYDKIIKAGGAINPEALCTFAHLCPDPRIVGKYLEYVRKSYNRDRVY
jgi:hypothetical protein